MMFYQIAFWAFMGAMIGVLIGLMLAWLIWQLYAANAIARGDLYMQMRRGKECHEYGERIA